MRLENGPTSYSKRTLFSFAGRDMRVCMVASMPMGVVREASRTSPAKRREKRTPLASRQGSGRQGSFSRRETSGSGAR
jgi:hypothetical protein